VEFVILTVQSAEERNIVFRNVLLLFLLMFCPARMCQKGRALQTDLVVMTNSVDCCLIEMMWKNDVTFCLFALHKCPYWTEVEVSGLISDCFKEIGLKLLSLCDTAWRVNCAVHRIGRTGRCGKTGMATTFVNKTCGTCARFYFSFLFNEVILTVSLL